MKSLFSVGKRAYGKDYLAHYLEQYKLFVESVEKISDRRQLANNYFVAINTALVSVIGISLQMDSLKDADSLRLLLATIGIIICLIFWFLIRSYKQLNTGKFAIIHEIEKHLPLALYASEWEIIGKGKDKNKYYPFSHIELLVPWVFGFIYLFLGVYFIVSLAKPLKINPGHISTNNRGVFWCLRSRHFDRRSNAVSGLKYQLVKSSPN